jgi:hypothetical protein
MIFGSTTARCMDKLTQDPGEWRFAAECTSSGALTLFQSSNIFNWFPAAILAHHALEKLLKSALIREGCAITNGKPQEGCVWGHDLVKLAELLASKRQDFPRQLSEDLAVFDAFFDELRYPRSPGVGAGRRNHFLAVDEHRPTICSASSEPFYREGTVIKSGLTRRSGHRSFVPAARGGLVFDKSLGYTRTLRGGIASGTAGTMILVMDKTSATLPQPCRFGQCLGVLLATITGVLAFGASPPDDRLYHRNDQFRYGFTILQG